MRVTKTWIACDAPRCDRDELVLRAVRVGWVHTDDDRDLCPDHAPREVREVFDWRAEIAGTNR